MPEAQKSYQTKFSFGISSALITNLSLIVGLDTGHNAKISIISGILLIALADNVSDSFAIHIFRESEQLNRHEVWLSTFSNFFFRMLVSFSFIFLILFFPLRLAVIISLIWGMLVLIFLSYLIAKSKKINILKSILEHVSIAGIVITASHFIGRFILSKI